MYSYILTNSLLIKYFVNHNIFVLDNPLSLPGSAGKYKIVQHDMTGTWHDRTITSFLKVENQNSSVTHRVGPHSCPLPPLLVNQWLLVSRLIDGYLRSWPGILSFCYYLGFLQILCHCNKYFKRNWVVATNSGFIIYISLKPNVVGLRYELG